MYGASEIQTGEKRNLRAAIEGLASMPTATMPWWKSIAMMNENKGVFGLNMLSWWNEEGGLDRMIEPLAAGLGTARWRPVVAEAFSFERAADAHRFIARAPEHRQGGPDAVSAAAPILLTASIGILYESIVATGRQAELLFFVAFLMRFGFIRTSAHMIRAQVSWWPGNVQVGGTHIHHLVWGICLLLIAAASACSPDPARPGPRSTRSSSASARA